jgi:hypothetical protein
VIVKEGPLDQGWVTVLGADSPARDARLAGAGDGSEEAVDTSAPSGSVVINGGAASTLSRFPCRRR